LAQKCGVTGHCHMKPLGYNEQYLISVKQENMSVYTKRGMGSCSMACSSRWYSRITIFVILHFLLNIHYIIKTLSLDTFISFENTVCLIHLSNEAKLKLFIVGILKNVIFS